MKINVLGIVGAHVRTLRDSRSGRISIFDCILFFGIPLICGGVLQYMCISFDRESFNVSISVFSIFAGLLLNVQVALFGILQRSWIKNGETQDVDRDTAEILKTRTELLGEINANISYLVVVCCVSVSFLLVMHVFVINESVRASSALGGVYVHFVLTLMMVIKRSFSLFDMEYNREVL